MQKLIKSDGITSQKPVAGGLEALLAGARDSSRRNIPSVQRAQFHNTRLPFGRSAGLNAVRSKLQPLSIMAPLNAGASCVLPKVPSNAEQRSLTHL
jgi:hypothetical protein